MGMHFDKLTPQDQVVLNTFLQCYNYAQAARASFTDGKTREVSDLSALGRRIIDKPEVQLAMAERLAEITNYTNISVGRVLDELAAIGFSNITDFLDFSEAGVILKDSSQIDHSKMAAISEIRQTKDGVIVKMHNKGNALEMLGKHLLMFVERKVVQHNIDGKVQLERVIEGLDLNGVMSRIQKQGLIIEHEPQPTLPDPKDVEEPLDLSPPIKDTVHSFLS